MSRPLSSASLHCMLYLLGSVVLGSGADEIVVSTHVPIPVTSNKIVINATNFSIPKFLRNILNIFLPAAWQLPSLPATDSTSLFADIFVCLMLLFVAEGILANLLIDQVVIYFDADDKVERVDVTVSVSMGKISDLIHITNAVAIVRCVTCTE